MSSSNPKDKSSDTPDIGVGMPTKPTNNPIIDAYPNEFRSQMPSTLMTRRKEPSKVGKAAVIQVNSHVVEQWPTIDIYQYDVSLSQPFSFPSCIDRHVDHHWQWR